MDPFSHIKCQSTAVETLKRALRSERVASAYLFEGPSGVGKTALAMAFAKELVAPAALADSDAPGPDRTRIDRQRIDGGNHPDVRVFHPREEGHRNLAVDTIREEVVPFAQFAPFESKHAVLVFPEADISFPEQHPEAANAMLKTLEEPRPGVHFLLLADRPERLLRTIRSRCQSVRFGRLGEAQLRQILDEAGSAEEGREIALSLADGRADRALALMEEGLGESLLQEAQALRDVIARRGSGEMVNASEELSKHANLELLLDALTYAYRREAVQACGAAAPADDPTSIDFVAVDRTTAGILRIRQCVDSFEWNANRTSAIDSMLFDLSAIA